MNRINYIKRTNKTFLSGNKYMGKIKNSAYSPQLNNNHNNTYTLSLINRCDNSYSSKINHKKYSHNVIFLIINAVNSTYWKSTEHTYKYNKYKSQTAVHWHIIINTAGDNHSHQQSRHNTQSP